MPLFFYIMILHLCIFKYIMWWLIAVCSDSFRNEEILAEHFATASGRHGVCQWQRLGIDICWDSIPVEPMHQAKVSYFSRLPHMVIY